jgi:hypothetical protein
MEVVVEWFIMVVVVEVVEVHQWLGHLLWPLLPLQQR